ncbi:MAG: DUF2125 domain-containing protein [Exiguobacterium profundum]|nr:MAG: DUF2125 domain-containing protein [Exiguobacterium profundum]
MKKLIALVVFVAVLWGGYWVVGSRLLVRGVQGWVQMQTEAGLEVGQTGLAVQGFPNRFDLTLTEPFLRDPATGFGWRADWLQSLMMGWKPWHVILVAPQDWVLMTPMGDLPVQADSTRASLVVVPGKALLIDRFTLVAEAPQVTLPTGVLAASDLRVATRRLAAGSVEQELGVQIDGLTGTGRLAAAGTGQVKLDAVVGFSGLPGLVVAEPPVVVQTVDLREARLDWDTASLAVTGQLAADAQGQAEGRLEVTLTGGPVLLPLAVAAGLVPERLAPAVTAMVTRMQASAGEGKPLVLPLTFARGQMRLGILPLGPAPFLN